MRLEKKIAVVTGGASGIGEAICELFAREGARVVVADIDADGGAQTVSSIESDGGDAIFVKTDVSQEDEVSDLVTATLDSYGGVDVLVNDAAAFVFGEVQDVTADDWAKVLGVNVLGAAHTVKNFSISSLIAQPAFVPYNTSKGALLQLTR